jgi:soluble lytic murein transglycosylase-like protein
VKIACLLLLFFANLLGWARTTQDSRKEAEYYVAAYARHYGVPVDFVRAVIEQESSWRPCAISSKGAVGLMQLMPATAISLGVRDRCNISQNVSGGVRYLAWLMNKFRGDLRLVAAAYYAGEQVIEARGLEYANMDVVAYVGSVRARMDRQIKLRSAAVQGTPRRMR